MSMETDVDHQIKPRLIKDMIHLNNFESYDDFMEKAKKPVKKQSNIQ